MRLIDADLFMENVRKELNCDERCCECVHDNLCEIYKMKLKQHTAFDLESVIEKINRLEAKAIPRYKGGAFGDYECTDYYVKRNEVLEILKPNADTTDGKNGG